jgi:SAM-dependent methyltransferase
MRVQDLMGPIHLYAGDVPEGRPYHAPVVGLSLSYDNDRHILHDIRNTLPFDNETVHSYQSESVMEYIDWWLWPKIISEAHRVLVSGGIFRLSVPDYQADVLCARCQYNESGAVCYDPGGGVDVRWFPTVEPVLWLCNQSDFRYYDGYITLMHGIYADGHVTMKDIDYSMGYIKRTPDHDPRAQNPRRVLSLVVDMVKA